MLPRNGNLLIQVAEITDDSYACGDLALATGGAAATFTRFRVEA